MRLTTKGRFAVTAMIDLALNQHVGPVTLSSISQRQHISLSYLEQLFAKLRRAHLVESTRGPGGGYSLGKRAAHITVTAIVTSVDEPLDATHCEGREQCSNSPAGLGKCMTHDLWTALNAKMVEFLDSVTLDKLISEQQHKQNQMQTPAGLTAHADVCHPMISMVIQQPMLKRGIGRLPQKPPVHLNTPNSIFALGVTLQENDTFPSS